MWKVPKGQRMGMCHGAANEESAERAMDEESAEGQWMKKVLIEGKRCSEGPKGNNWGTLSEGADRIWPCECDEWCVVERVLEG